ncbi:MAG: DinB family protein [Candidatus Sumerlaeaceae bacterium]
MITPQIVMDSFKAVRGNTIQIARDIPADQYSFRATPETRSVLEYFRDIIRVTEFVVGVALSSETVRFTERSRDEWARIFVQTDVAALNTPNEVAAALQSSIQDLYKRVTEADDGFLNETFLAPDNIHKVRLWMINTAKEQEMVLRGQLLLIERMLGIVPHTTRRQQEAQRAKEQRSAKES